MSSKNLSVDLKRIRELHSREDLKLSILFSFTLITWTFMFEWEIEAVIRIQETKAQEEK